MRIKNVYKRTAALIFLMVVALWPVAEAWGQVTGDRYRMKISTEGAEITARTDNNTPAGDSDGAFISAAFDGNDNTWWMSSQKKEDINININFTSPQTIQSLHFYRAGTKEKREKSVQVYISSDGTNWGDPVGTFTNDDSNLNAIEHDYYLGTSITTKYLRLRLENQKANGNHPLVVNEITIYGFGDYINKIIQHKPAKWHDLRSSLNISQAAKDMDTFNDMILWDQIKFPGMENYQVQSAHTLIDTIYVHKGSSVRLNLPDRLKTTTNMNSYQRWYSFRTDKTFEVNNPSYTGGIKDLLTPATPGSYYRFNNGYVVYSNEDNENKPYSMDFYFPTDDEFPSMFTGFETTRDNNWYLVACDVSGYDDFTNQFAVASSNQSTFLPNAWEPTLTHRVIYYICAVENESNWYVKALKNQKDDEYLEDYVIHMPATRLPNKTNEMVALSKDARAYALPDGETTDDLTVSLDTNNNTAGITLAEGNDSHTADSESDGEFTLTGETRKIHFLYPKGNPDNTRSVNGNNTEATILVTKGEKNIARFRLVFTEENRLLTQSQVNELDQLTAPGEGWKSLAYRTPNKLNTNSSYELLTELNFDYDPNVARLYGASQYYPFPMAWENSSYGFFDGGAADYISSRAKDYTEWGNYSILNDYLECGTWAWNQSKPSPVHLVNSKGANSTYHLFVDASDRPGVIARLPFRENLCKGTELFVSAWVKSARFDTNADNAGMLFTIMGAETDENGQEKLTPIYRYQTGQIPATYQNDQSINLPGFDTGKNEWFQVYFSFINSGDLSFNRYILQIDNNSASTSGGDMYLDDVRVYMATPSATVTQLEATCTNERTRMNIKMDWDRLLSRRGETELSGTESKWDAIDFCFIDTLIYHNAIEAGLSEVEAIKASIVKVGSTQDGTGEVEFASLYFNLNFTENMEYGSEGNSLANQNLVSFKQGDIEIKGGNGFYSYEDESGQKFLSVDFYSELSPYRPYMMLISPAGIDGVSPTVNDFEDIIGEPCGIMTDFWVESQNIVKMNGEIIDPNTRFCAGQIFNFSVQLTVPIVRVDGAADTIYVNDGVYFDWFFGETNDPEAEFTQIQEKYDVSIEQALKAFRAHYPDATTIDDTTPAKNGTPEVGSDVSVNFSKEMRDLLLSYIGNSGEEGGLHNRLILHRSSLDITLLQSGLRLVVSPIQTERPPREDIPGDQWSLICWKYIPLMLETSGESPQLHLGFDDMNYPKEGYEAALRIGLKQIERANSESSFLRVNLRGATFVSEDQGAYMSPIKDNIDGVDYLRLYLVDTNDPQYPQFANGEIESIRYDYPIGTLHDLYATRYTSSGQFNNGMDISFDISTILDNGFKFDPREGYWYRFVVYYEERVDDGSVGNACQNSMNVLMKVVPEYLVWDDQQKSADYSIIGNWNNDGNWKRADKGRLLKADNDSYPTNEKNETDNGFVPMHFSKVIMPENSKVELYAAGSSGRNWITQRPSHIAAPTDSIQYDLMAFESGSPLKTERYRVSLLNQIHFEPGAEMLHAEYLLYDTAWVDYQLDKGRWYTLASPLKAVYAGDFYTDKSGTEGSEYFQPIEFNYGTELTNNDRFSPSVYQRGWKGSNATMVGTPGGERAIAGNWSALYNKVDEAYTPGTGFSLKVQDIADNSSAIFRLPKADMNYSYYPIQEGDDPVQIIRNNAHRLQSDEIYQRTDNSTVGNIQVKDFTVPLGESADGQYYLVGNPFMAHLDMTKFFNETTGNGSVLQKKYWLVTDENQTAAVGTGDGSWVTVDGNSTPTVAPLQSFFVQKANNETGEITVKFTQEMQTLGGSGDGLRSANALTITATTSDGRTSRAAVAYDMAASADYEASEDAELFLDSNLGDVPMVYTVAGTMATSINRTSELYNIPLGVYGSKQEMVTLSFGGLNQFSSATLYDAQEQTETPLREGKTVSVPAGTSGRYFLRAGTPTGNEVIARNAFLVYSVGGGKVMVTSSNTPLKDIRVYTMGGAQVRSIQASGMQQEIYLNRGIYLITVSDQDGLQETRKVLVR